MRPALRSASFAGRCALLVLAAAFVRPSGTAAGQPQTWAFVNGRAFDGAAFAARPLYVNGGVFVADRPARLDTTVDLGGAFVVPPFGDAHTHMLSDPSSVGIADRYVREGILYVQVLTNVHSLAQRVMDRFNRPGALDVAYAHAGVTAPESHPRGVYEAIALGYMSRWPWTPPMRDSIRASRRNEGDAYFYVNTAADLNAVWPRFLAQRPNVVKIYLLDAAGELPADPDALDAGAGLPPALVRPVVERAHAAGLQVFAHVETAADVRLALDAGVDGFAHLPGYGLGGTRGSFTPYRLDDATVALAGARRAVFVPTFAIGRRDSTARMDSVRAFQRETLGRLLGAGARVVLGADSWGSTAALEANYVHAHRYADNATLLRLWAETTPRAIFPRRRIGRLEPGYEASLLVLGCDPVAAYACTRDVRLRVKQGAVLVPPPENAAAAGGRP